MDILSLILDNSGTVLQVLGGITGALGVTIPFLSPSNTKTLGIGIGKILKVLLRQKPKSKLKAKRYSNTISDLADGVVEGLN